MKTVARISFFTICILIFSSCAYQAPELYSPNPNPDDSLPSVVGRTWVLSSGITGAVTLKISDNSSVSGRSYCNNYSSRLTEFANAEIKFGAIMSSKKNCEYIELEDEYFELLSFVDSYEITENSLILYWSTGGKKGSLVFYPQRQSTS